MRIVLLSLSLFFTSTLIMAQVWAPSGATWHYDWTAMWNSGYVEIQYTGDTTIGGKSCKILKKERHSYDWINHTYSTSVIGYEYTYLENNIVYYLRYGQFFKLYDFNATSGSSWKVAGWNQNNPCDSTGTIVVDTTGMTIINSFSLKYLKVSPGLTSTWAFSSDTIIERIGSLVYMFPEPNCIPDVYEGGALRCYYDDSFGLYERGSAPTCDYITGVDNMLPESNFVKIHPVPATSTITLEFTRQIKGKMRIEISDIVGNKIKMLETDRAELIIGIEDLKRGIYFISISDKSGLLWNQKIIKNSP
jgi:Secretion system C-terminal sorting domain